MPTVRRWPEYPPHQRSAVRRQLGVLVSKSSDRELTHEMIEEALTTKIPDLSDATVEDDSFHELVTEVYSDYIKQGGVD